MITQTLITITTILSVVFVQFDDIKYRKFASVFALAGEPFWLYAGWQAEMWGIVLCTILYTIVWMFGFYRAWIK